jgi:predicted Zn finger-like uncharacterized protein
MPISIVCTNCRTPYNVPDHLAGRTVSCKRCNELLDVPGPGGGGGGAFAAPRPIADETPYDRVLGKPTPVFVEVLGIHTKFNDEFGLGDALRLIWSMRHLAFLVILIGLWMKYISPPLEAEMAAPFFFGAGVVIVLASLVQLSSLARNSKVAVQSRSNQFLSGVISSGLLVTMDPRTAIPALRTFFLGVLTLSAALTIASSAGSWKYIVPIKSFSGMVTPPPAEKKPEFEFGSKPGPVEPEQTRTVTPPPPPTPPSPPPSTQEKPIPPPEETGTIPPPPE